MIKKRYILISAVVLISATGAGVVYYYHQLTNNSPFCSKSQIKELSQDIDIIINNWDDANSLAASSPRIALTNPVIRLQDIQKEVRNLSVPNCAEPLIESLLEMTDETIKSYLLFMEGESDSNIQEQVKTVKYKQTFFITSYSLFKEGKSIKKTDVSLQVITDATKKLRDSIKEIK